MVSVNYINMVELWYLGIVQYCNGMNSTVIVGNKTPTFT